MNKLPPMSGYSKIVQAQSATPEEALPKTTTQRDPSAAKTKTQFCADSLHEKHRLNPQIGQQTSRKSPWKTTH